MQASLWLGVVIRWYKAKALQGGCLDLFCALIKTPDTFANNDFKLMLFVNPVAHIAPVNAYCERALRRKQQLPITGLTLDKTCLFLAQLRFQALGHLEGVIAHRFDVQTEINW